MGQTILTPKQLNFLELAQAEPKVTGEFYFTGGTPLSAFYLKHRLSEDIDLFNEKQEVDQTLTDAFLRSISPKLSIKQIKRSQFLGLVSYKLIYNDSEELKVDFNYYPFPRIEKGIKYKGLAVDSVYDIAVNKIHTMFMKPRTRDYVDMYYIMNSLKYPLEKLISDAKIKFDWDIDRVNLANQFIKVTDIKEAELPKMLLPFDQDEMEKFFLDLAKNLKGEIFRK